MTMTNHQPATGGLGIRIDFHGRPKQALHWLINLDLGDRLWSPDKSIWAARAPGVWDRIGACYAGTSPEAQRQLVVQTAPSRVPWPLYGTVLVNPGLVQAHFWAAWDQDRHDEIPDLTRTFRGYKCRVLMGDIAVMETGLLALVNTCKPIPVRGITT